MTSSIVEMFRKQVARLGDQAALRTKANGAWIDRTWREWDETASAVAAGLIELGARPGERVAIFANTRREWAEADVGVMLAGAVTVPLYQQTTPEGAAYILADSESTIVFAEDPLQLEKLFDPAVRSRLRNLRRVIYFDARRKLDRPDARGRLQIRLEDVVPAAERSTVMSYAEFLEAGRRVLRRDGNVVRARADAVGAHDPATIVYTSGTTGEPKGVVLTHGNLAFECACVEEKFGLTSADEQLLFLPLAHIFARVLLVVAIRAGCVTSFATSPQTALDEIREVHPTFFGAVPRVYERVHTTVTRGVAHESPLRRRAASLAFAVGRRVSRARQLGHSPGRVLGAQHRLASLAVLERVRHVFGRRLRFAIAGGAPLSRELAEWFHACGVLVLEGYGLTETTAATHINVPGAYRFGTVGRAVPGVQTRIADDGEVLVRGGNVMAGYFKRSDETAAVIDAAGWLHTGDVGRIDDAGYLTITDRKKDLLITASGKNVAPQGLEAALRRAAWVSQAVVVGEGRQYLVALVTLDEPAVRAWATGEGMDLGWAELAAHPAVRRVVSAQIATVNRGLEPFQQVRRFAIVAREFSVEAREMTASLKVRRQAVVARHAREIEALYVAESD